MERIRIIKLGKSFGIKKIFENVSFEIKTGDRLALVGPNGAGKSTLLKTILGLEELDEGQIVVSDGATIGYLQQDVNLGSSSLEEEIQKAWADVHKIEKELEEVSARLATEQTNEGDLNRLARLQERMEWLGGYDYEQQSRRIAYSLGFTEEDLKKSADQFSGGQKTRINLAKSLVRRPDFLFLDEPTNHLDMDMLEWLEGYLSSYGGGLLVVSHDRYFLDRIATGVVELNHHKTTVYKGNYTRYAQQEGERRKAAQAAYEKQQEYIKATEAYIDKYRAGIKSKMARGRQSQLDRLERLEAPEYSDSLRFAFPPVSTCADKVLVVDKVSASYGDNPIFTNLSFMIRRGEGVSLIGPNGAGKSTLVKAIMGELSKVEGIIDIGNRVQIGYFSQEHEELHEDWSVLEEIVNAFNYSEDKARNVLGMFLFRGDAVFTLVSDLSGGERARLSLLKLFLEGDNFLILDEPTNHLDIPTREVVEEALSHFTGTYLVISHDRYFLDKIAKRTLSLSNGKLTDVLGNYSYFKEKEKEKVFLAEQADIIEKTNASEKQANSKGTEGKKDNFTESSTEKEIGSAYKHNKLNSYMQAKQLEEVEEAVARSEATIKMYEVQLSMIDPQEKLADFQVIAQQMEEEQKRLDTLYSKWERLLESDEK